MKETIATGADLPLAGIRVLAFEHAVAAPLATRHLADLGAEVLKIERPGVGDFARDYDRAVFGQSSFFVWLNRGKQSMTLDLKHPDAAEIITRLIARSDVLVQNLAPGAAARLGMSYDDLAPHHPGLVVCDISGYGDAGPYADRKAYDLLIQAEAGLMSVTGTPETPARAGISAADIATGMYAFSSCLAALVRRGRTGRGAHVRVAMIDALSEWMGNALYHAAYGAGAPERRPDTHPGLAPYGAYRVDQGQACVLLGVQNEREWAEFCCIVLKRPGLALDASFSANTARVANRAELTRLIEEVFADLRLEEVTERLQAAGIANGRLNDARQVWDHPQLAARDRWRMIETPAGSVRALMPPMDFADVEAVMGDVPALGAHTDAVLAALGYTPPAIEGLHKNKVV